MVNCILIKTTWNMVEVNIYKTYINPNNLTDASINLHQPSFQPMWLFRLPGPTLLVVLGVSVRPKGGRLTRGREAVDDVIVDFEQVLLVPLPSLLLVESAESRSRKVSGTEIRTFRFEIGRPADLSLRVGEQRLRDGLVRSGQLEKVRKVLSAADLSLDDLSVGVLSFPALDSLKDRIRGRERTLFRVREIDTGCYSGIISH